jgi:DNA-binding transcriptional ArsR family regulator
VADNTNTTDEPGGSKRLGERKKLRPHPARDRIVDLLRRSPEPITPVQMAAITGETIGRLSYHIRTLREAGVIELVREGQVRGSVEHYYSLAPQGQDDERVADVVFGLLNICGALTLPDPNGGKPRATVIDERGRAQLLALIEKVEPRVLKIAEASTQRSLGRPAATGREAGHAPC